MATASAKQKTGPKPSAVSQPKEVPAVAKAAVSKAKATVPAAKSAAKAAAPAAKPVAKVAAPAAKPAVKMAAKPAVKPAARTPVAKAKLVGNGQSAAAAKPAKATVKPAAAVPAEKEKIKKIKLVRDSFTMPEAEYAVLGQVKKTCLKAGVEVKKSELLRIGVALIRGMDVANLKAVLATLPQLKSGRPVKEK